MKNRTKEWFEHKLMIFEKMAPSKGKKLTSTKGYKPDVDKDKKQQRIDDLRKEAKKRGFRI